MKVKENFIEAFDLPDAWYQCIDKILTNGYEYVIERGSFVSKKRKELDFVILHIKNPGNRPIIPEIPKSLEGIVPPPTDMKYVYEYLLSYLYTGDKKEGESYTYGSRLVGEKISFTSENIKNELKRLILGRDTASESGKEVNQIVEVIKIYKNTPNTNQAIMEIGKPTDILLDDPPCLRLIDTRVRYGKLHFYIYFRSWDAWAGLPVNLAGLQLLKEYMAEEIGVDDGEIIALSKGLHLYDYQWELAEYLTGRKSLKK